MSYAEFLGYIFASLVIGILIGVNLKLIYQKIRCSHWLYKVSAKQLSKHQTKK